MSHPKSSEPAHVGCYGVDQDVTRLLVQSLGCLGTLYRIEGRYKEAAPLLRRALRLAERAFLPGDLETASALNNLAVLYKYQNRFAQARRLYHRAMGIMDRA